MSDNKNRPTTATDVHVEVKESHTHEQKSGEQLKHDAQQKGTELKQQAEHKGAQLANDASKTLDEVKDAGQKKSRSS